MPFKSEAQRRKFYAMEEDGEIPKGTTARWEKETKDKDLPEKVKKESAFMRAVQRAMEYEKGAAFDPRNVERIKQMLQASLTQTRAQSARRVQKLVPQLSSSPYMQTISRKFQLSPEEVAKMTLGARRGPVYQPKFSSAKESIPGGLAAGKPDSKYYSEQLRMGIKVEKEHTPDSAKAKEIAKDHLEEFPNYYTALDRMERKLEQQKESALSRALRKQSATACKTPGKKIRSKGKGRGLAYGKGEGPKGRIKELIRQKMSAELTEATREDIPTGEFALPGRRYPIHDKAHAENALARVSQHGTPEERATVRKKVYAKYPELKESFKEREGESPTAEGMLKKEKLGYVQYGSPEGYAYLNGILKEAVLRRKTAAGVDPLEEQRKQQLHEQQMQFAEDRHQLELQRMQMQMEQQQAVQDMKSQQMQESYQQEAQAKQQAQAQTQQMQQPPAPTNAQQDTQRRQNLLASQSPPQQQ